MTTTTAAPPPLTAEDQEAALRYEARRREMQREQAELDRADAARARKVQDAENRKTKEDRRVERARRRTRLVLRLRKIWDAVSTYGFLVCGGLAALYGQFSYGVDHYAAPGSPLALRVALAITVSVAAELMALYVGQHAHDALLRGDTLGAAKLRRYAYLIAMGIGTLNYLHFLPEPTAGAAQSYAPNPASLIFAAFSVASPWVWGLHTRRAQHAQLVAAGRADCPGAVFGRDRRLAFPLLTRGARRYSLLHGITNPEVAWTGYLALVSAGREPRWYTPLANRWVALLGADRGGQSARQADTGTGHGGGHLAADDRTPDRAGTGQVDTVSGPMSGAVSGPGGGQPADVRSLEEDQMSAPDTEPPTLPSRVRLHSVTETDTDSGDAGHGDIPEERLRQVADPAFPEITQILVANQFQVSTRTVRRQMRALGLGPVKPDAVEA